MSHIESPDPMPMDLIGIALQRSSLVVALLLSFSLETSRDQIQDDPSLLMKIRSEPY